MPPLRASHASQLRAIADARTRLAAADSHATTDAVALADARRELAALTAAGATPAARRSQERRVATLVTRRERSLATAEASLAEVERLRGGVVAADAPERLVEALDGQVPIALWPIRLETRFTADRSALRIRIYPDMVHKRDDEPELTDAELAAAREYWEARWDAAGDTEAVSAAWKRLARRFRPPRARWLVLATTPTNVANLGRGRPRFPTVPKRAGAWTRPATAGLLPDRWVALGYRGGKEVFRTWGAQIAERVAMGPAPDLDSTEPVAVDATELPIDEGLRWLADYDEALRIGMAITVSDSDLVSGRLASGLDLLVVTGVDWSLDPEGSAAALDGQLAAHARVDGLSFMPVGTPTNTTASGAAGAGSGAEAALLDPANPPPALGADSAGARAARALGLGTGDSSALGSAPGASAQDSLAAGHMATALWAPTCGYFIDQMLRPLVADADSAQIREHFRAYVRGRGPLPTVRIGEQPYGLLPVVAPESWQGDAPVEQAIGERLRPLRPLWDRAAASVPELGLSEQPDHDLVALLRLNPRSATFRLRRATGAAVLSAGTGLEQLASFQELGARALLALGNVAGRPRLVDVTLDEPHRLLPLRLVARHELSETRPLEPNYVTAIAADLSRTGGFRSLVTRPAPADSLLEALLRQAAQLEVVAAAGGLVVVHELTEGVLQAEPRHVAPRERELHGIDADDIAPVSPSAGQRQSLLDTVASGIELANRSVSAISGSRTLANQLALTSIADLGTHAGTKALGEFRASLDYLATLPEAELGRLTAETLDCCSHRLDAWLTSLASRRLDAVRETMSGTYLGGYGWLEDVRPRSDAQSLGYVHAPSVAHASSAAILHSGHLSRRLDDPGALAIDLSSSRVAGALELLDGMRQGHPIGALLGYRLERALRDRRMALAAYILALRQAAPLATATDGFDDGRPLEAIAARDVVDGIALLDRWRPNPPAFFGSTPGLPASGPDRDDLHAELARLDETLDAVSDLLLAETVHQVVAGSDERAAAALDALDRQSPIPDVGVVQTPRTGTSASHRLLLALHDAPAPAGWAADPRGAAEPRLNAWLARVLGDPARIRVAAVAYDADGREVQRVQATLAELGISPLGAVLAASSPAGVERASDLEARLALVLAGKVTVSAAASLELLSDPPAGSASAAIGLAELLHLARQVLDLVGSCRPASAADLVLDTELRDPAPLDPGYDLVELERRADAAVRALERAVESLPSATSASPATLVTRLLAASDAGVPGAVPGGADRGELEAQVERVRSAGAATLASLEAAQAGFVHGSASPAARVQYHLGRLRAVFGEAFPAAAVFRPANVDALAASLGDATAVLDGDPLAPTTWLAQHALVRPAVGRFVTVLEAAELLGRDLGLDQLQVAQLPHLPGERWIGLPGERPEGSLGLVVHSPGGFRPRRPVAAWVVDAWQDVVPSAVETTGVSFHFDAPGARAPQTLLLAVPPNSTAASWSLETLAGTIREAHALARIRAVDLDQLTGVPRFLPALYLPFNLERLTPSVDFHALIDNAIRLDNEAFIAERDGGP
jgi:hypothetical protein